MMKHKNRFLIIGIIFAALTASATFDAVAATIQSQASGNWSSPGTWNGNVVPTATDDVEILGHSVVLDVDAKVKSLTMSNAASELEPESGGVYTLTINGDLTLSNATAEIFHENQTNNSGLLNLEFDVDASSISTPSSSDKINVNDFIVKGELVLTDQITMSVYGNLVVTGGGVFQNEHASTTITMRGKYSGVYVTSGATDALKLNALTVAATGEYCSAMGDMTFDKLYVNDGGKFKAEDGTVTITTSFWTNTATSGDYVIEFNDLEIDGTVTHTGKYQINGDLTVNSGSSLAPAAAGATTDGEIVNFTGEDNTITVPATSLVNSCTFEGMTLASDAKYAATGNILCFESDQDLNVTISGEYTHTSGSFTTQIANLAGAYNITLSTGSNDVQFETLVFDSYLATPAVANNIELSSADFTVGDLLIRNGCLVGGDITTYIPTGAVSGTISINSGTFAPDQLTIPTGVITKISGTATMNDFDAFTVPSDHNTEIDVYGTLVVGSTETGGDMYLTTNLSTGTDTDIFTVHDGATLQVEHSQGLGSVGLYYGALRESNTVSGFYDFDDGMNVILAGTCANAGLDHLDLINMTGSTTIAQINDLTVASEVVVTALEGAADAFGLDLQLNGDLTVNTSSTMNLSDETHTVTMEGASAEIDNDGSLLLKTLTIDGTVTTSSTFSLTRNENGAVKLLVNSGGSLSASSGTIAMTGTATTYTHLINDGTLKFYDLAISGGSVTCSDDFEVQGHMLVGASGSFSSTYSSDVTFSGEDKYLIFNSHPIFFTMKFADGASYQTLPASNTITVSGWGSGEGLVLEGAAEYLNSSGTIIMNPAATNDCQGTGNIIVASNADLRVGNFSIDHNANEDIQTFSDFTILEGLYLGENGAGDFQAYDGEIDFQSSDASMEDIYLYNTSDNLEFNDVLFSGSDVGVYGFDATTTYSFDVGGNFTVSENGKFAASTFTRVEFSGINKSLRNYSGLAASCSFTDLYVLAGSKINNYGDITIGGNLDLRSASSEFTCHDGTVAISDIKVTPYAQIIVATGASLQFHNLNITSAASTVSSSDFSIAGNLAFNNTNGNYVVGYPGVITFNGEKHQTISGTVVPDFYQMVVNKSSGDVKLSTNISVTSGLTTHDSKITLTKGDLDLNGNYSVYLIPNASNNSSIVESNGYTIKNSVSTGAGSVTFSAPANNAIGEDLAGLGVESGVGGGDISYVYRYPRAVSLTSAYALKRYYYVAGGSLTDVTFKYDDSEMPGGAESNLRVFYSTTNSPTTASAWTQIPDTYFESVNSSLNEITYDLSGSGITASYFAVALADGIVKSNATTAFNGEGDEATATSGYWNDATAWTPQTVPTSSDLVVIQNDHIMILNQDATCAGMVFEGTGKLRPDISGEYDLSTSKDVTFNSSNSRLESLNGAGLLNVDIDGGTKAIPISLNLANDNNFSANDLTIDGNLTQSGNYNLNLRGDLSLVDVSELKLLTGTVNFNGNGAQLITKTNASTIRFNNINVEAGPRASTDASFYLGGNITNSTGEFVCNKGTVTMDGSAQSITANSAGTLQFNNLFITDATDVTTSSNFYVSGNFELDDNATFDAGGGYVIFDNIGQKTIVNNSNNLDSDLEFSGLRVTDKSKVTTASSFYFADSPVIDVEGTGELTATSGTISITANGEIDVDSDGNLEFNYFTIRNGAVVTTKSDFTIKDDFYLMGGSSSFTASSPSSVIFENKTVSYQEIIHENAGYPAKFFNLTIADESEVRTAYNIDIANDFAIEGNGVYNQSDETTRFSTSRTKDLLNDGECTFYNLLITDEGSNILNTNSHFTVTNEMKVGSSANRGGFEASGASVATLLGKASDGVNTPTSSAITSADENTCVFQNVVFNPGSGEISQPDMTFSVKGDFTSASGTFNPTNDASATTTIHFTGTREQLINAVSSAPKFEYIYVNNSNGVKLNTAIWVRYDLELYSGDVDLNGSNTISLETATSKLVESNANTVKNSVAGSGYITTAPNTGISKINAENSGLGFTFGSQVGANGIELRRYHNAVSISGTPSVERYYQLSDYSGTMNGAIFTYDNTELNGVDADRLSFFYTSTADAATTNWSPLGGTPNPGSYTGVVSKTSGISHTAIDTEDFLTVAPQAVTVGEFPEFGVEERNEIADSPLIAGSSEVIIGGFTLTANGDTEFLLMDIHFNITPNNKLDNFKLWVDQDGLIGSYGRGSDSLAAGVVDESDNKLVQFANFTSAQELTPGQTYYYFITADVSGGVNENTSAISFSFDEDDLTFSDNVIANDVNFGSDSYLFQQLEPAVNVVDLPFASNYVNRSMNDQAIYAFSITPQDNSPEFNLSSVEFNVYINNALIDADTDFDDFNLWLDQNRNGINDASDILLTGSTAISRLSGRVNIDLGSLVTIEDEPVYLVLTCDVDASAVYGKVLYAEIEDETKLTLTNSAIADDENAPWIGQELTVANPDAFSALEIVSIIPDLRVEANTDPDVEPGDDVIVDGARFSVIVQPVDASGRPVYVTADKKVRVYISSGSSTFYYDNTLYNATLPAAGSLESLQNKNVLIFNNCLATKAPEVEGEEGVKIKAEIDAASAAGETPYETGDMTLRAPEPTSSLDDLTATNITENTMDISWSNPGDNKCIVVVRANQAPVAPVDGIDYDAASSYDYSNPAATNGTTDAEATSVVVYESADGTADPNFTLGGLTAGTKYYIAVYNYNGSGETVNYLKYAKPVDKVMTINATTLESQPTAPSSNIQFPKVTDTTITVQWTKGGSGYESIVVARLGEAPATDPSDGVEYTANAALGATESVLGESYVVYAGPNNSVEVTNLAPNTTYYFEIFEYDGDGIETNYLTASYLSGNRSTLEPEPDVQASNINFSEMTLGQNTSIKVNWVNGTGDGRICLAQAEEAITEFPADHTGVYGTVTGPTNFGAGSQVGNAYVVYSGSTRNYVTVNGLIYGQTYYFRVFEYNGTGTTVDNSTLNYNTSEATGNPNSRIADSYEINDTMAEAKEISAGGTYYPGIVSSENDIDWLYFTPDVANNQTNCRVRLINMPENYTLELYDSNGKLLRRSKRRNTADEIAVINNVPEGSYYLKIYTEDGNTSLSPYRINVMTSTSEFMSDTP